MKTPDRIAWDMANEPWNAERILIDALTEREAAAYAQGRAEALEEAAQIAERGDYLFEGVYNRGIRVRGEQAAAAIRALAEPRR